MPNLVKQRYVLSDNRVARVIDSNEKLNEIYRDMNLQREDNQGPPTFEEGIFAERIELSDDYNEFYDEESGFSAPAEEPAISVEDANRMVEEMLEQARQDAEAILEQARQDAERIKEDAFEQGYSEGNAKAEEQCAQKELDLEYEFNRKQQQLEDEYNDALSNLESSLVEAFTEIIRKVLQVDIEDYSGIISELAIRTITHLDNPKNITIYVAPSNVEILREAESLFVEKLGGSVEIEVLRDDKLDVTQCKIETERGIYDCGFDTQLENLFKKMKLLSMRS